MEIFRTEIHTWIYNGNNFVFNSKWVSYAYDASKIKGRIVCGDFNRDGFKDDIAAFYDYGNFNTRLHAWYSNGNNFIYQGDYGKWRSFQYNAQKLIEVVSGDFNRDGFKDDIAGFYDYGNFRTEIHKWINNVNSFSYNSSWLGTDYDALKIKGRVVCGDFNRNEYEDDIAAFYDYGNFNTSIHTWYSNGNNFIYQGDYGKWHSTQYSANNITSRVAIGDFNKDDKKDDITAFYDYEDFIAAMHIWKGTNNGSMVYVGDDGWWRICSPSQVRNSLGIPDDEKEVPIIAKSITDEKLIEVFPIPSSGVINLLGSLKNCKIEIFIC